MLVVSKQRDFQQFIIDKFIQRCSKRLPGDHDVHLLPRHGVADGLGKDPCLVRRKVFRVSVDVEVPGNNVRLDPGSVDLANMLCVRGCRRVVSVAALVKVLAKFKYQQNVSQTVCMLHIHTHVHTHIPCAAS